MKPETRTWCQTQDWLQTAKVGQNLFLACVKRLGNQSVFFEKAFGSNLHKCPKLMQLYWGLKKLQHFNRLILGVLRKADISLGPGLTEERVRQIHVQSESSLCCS